VGTSEYNNNVFFLLHCFPYVQEIVVPSHLLGNFGGDP